MKYVLMFCVDGDDVRRFATMRDADRSAQDLAAEGAVEVRPIAEPDPRQAAIVACRTEARTWQDTGWPQILAPGRAVPAPSEAQAATG